MYDTARKYSEQRYVTKEKIAEEIDSYLFEPIWQEVKTYRSFFRYDLKINEKPFYLTRNPLVVNTILQLEEVLHTYESQHPLTYECGYLEDRENEKYKQYCTYIMVNKTVHPEEFFFSFFQQFHIQDIVKQQVLFLFNEEEPFLLRYFSLFLISSRRSRCLMQLPFLIFHQKEFLQEEFSMIEFADCYAMEVNGDITYAFLAMLEQLRLLLYKNMVSLNNTTEASFKVLQEKELMERFPIMRKEQIHFYVHHREIGHYYTIQNYIQQCKVCYETARYSLDQLVAHHWYEKKKIGKKFVYFIV